MWLLIHRWGSLEGNNPKDSLSLVYERIMPHNKRSMIRERRFMEAYLAGYERQRRKLTSSKLNQVELVSMLVASLRLFYKSVKTYTYIIPAIAKIVPEHEITDGEGPIEGDCFVGVNYQELVVFRFAHSPFPSVRLPLQDIRVTTTTFSMFVDYSYFMSAPTSSNLTNQEVEKARLRFDARMLYHFDQILNIYQNLKRIFPNTIL